MGQPCWLGGPKSWVVLKWWISIFSQLLGYGLFFASDFSQGQPNSEKKHGKIRKKTRKTWKNPLASGSRDANWMPFFHPYPRRIFKVELPESQGWDVSEIHQLFRPQDLGPPRQNRGDVAISI